MRASTEPAVADLATGTRNDRPARSRWFAAGGLLGALASASCCILPLTLFSLGAGGAWVGNLTRLAPYQPIFVVVTLVCLGAGFYHLYHRPAVACREGAFCARPVSKRVTKTALWSATVLVVAALAFPYVAPRLLGS